MDKQKIKHFLIEQQVRLVEELKEQTVTIHSMVDLDESNTLDPEDFSHQFESKEMEQMLKIQRNRAERGLEILASLDVSPKTIVETGAMIETDTLCFIIGYATIPFELDNKRFVGISTNSPIYAMMSGKKAGSTFSYAGNQFVINHIY